METVRVLGLTEDEQRTLDSLVKRLGDRESRNIVRLGYYDMERVGRRLSTIAPQYYGLGLTLGWCAKGVDSLARRCNLDAFVWPDGDLDALGYREVWDANFLATEVASARLSSLIHGVSFLVTTKGRDGEPDVLIHAKDALNATGEWNTRRRALDSLLSITDRDDKGQPTALVLYLPDLTITAANDGGWRVTDRQEHAWGVPAEPLVYRPRTGREFGSSRISRAAMGFHAAAIRTLMRLEGHSDVFSWPDMWLMGADESIFKNADGSTKTAWQVALGRIKSIPDDPEREGDPNARADVKQFQAASPGPHLDSLNAYAKLFAHEMDLPENALAIKEMANPQSADAYIASREELIAAAEAATDDWSTPLRRTMVRALAMRNGEADVPAEWLTIAAKWRSPMYLSRAAQADAGSKQLAAVPWLAETEVGLELLGLDAQQRARAMAEKRRAQARASITALTQPPQADAVAP